MINNASNVTSLAKQAKPEVVDAIRQASSQTGVDFSYLLQKAATESSFDTRAQASTSSARGLYQFVDRTWLDTIDKHGAEHGLTNAAAAIKRDSKGNPIVTDAATRQKILALRDDPRVSAFMAAELANDNKNSLENSLGRKVGNTELYLAHFLGAGGAAKFLSSMDHNPERNAAQVIPEAARANKGVFYRGGKSLTVDQVFTRFANKFDEGPAPSPRLSQAVPQVAEAAVSAARFSDPLATRYAHPLTSRPEIAALSAELATVNALTPASENSADAGTAYLNAFERNAVPNRIPMESLPMFAMRLIESMTLPGEKDDTHSQDWLA